MSTDGRMDGGEEPWSQMEARHLQVKDARLNRRLAGILAQAAAAPQASIPQQGRNWAQTQAVYRFLNNPKIDSQTLLQAHGQATLERAAGLPWVLLVQDSSDVDFTGRELAGAGPLDWDEGTGFMMHVNLVVPPERVPLGVLAAKFWTHGQKRRRTRCRKQVPFAAKHSVRWREGYDLACQVQRQLGSGTRVISVADREADIYECFAAAQNQARAGSGAAHLLVRAAQNRAVYSPQTQAYDQELFATLAAAPGLATCRFLRPARPGQPEREVRQQLHAQRVQLRPPWRPRGSKLPAVELYAVLAVELEPPPDQEPVTWLLLTTLPVVTAEEALAIQRFYLCRWEIEVFFRILKSGCRIEARQFRSAQTMLPCLALFMPVAWRIRFLQQTARAQPDAPCTVCCTTTEWQVLHQVVRRRLPPPQVPTLREFIALLGKAGGHLSAARAMAIPAPNTSGRG